MKAFILPGTLSFVAGWVDTAGFLALSGLFTSHITGNLVLLFVRLVSHQAGLVSRVIAVPVFIVVVLAVSALVHALNPSRPATLRITLALETAALALFLALGVACGPFRDPDAAIAIGTGMAGVTAMAIQNAMNRLVLPGRPTTTVMTSNVTQVVVDAAYLIRHGNPGEDEAKVRERFRRMLPNVVCFVIGCGCGAGLYAGTGFWTFAVPLALVAGLTLRPEEPLPRPVPR